MLDKHLLRGACEGVPICWKFNIARLWVSLPSTNQNKYYDVTCYPTDTASLNKGYMYPIRMDTLCKTIDGM